MSGFFSKPVTPTLASLGLDQINNTSDANKPVSTLQQTAIAAAVNPTRRTFYSKGTSTANVIGTSSSTTYPIWTIPVPANTSNLPNSYIEIKMRVNANVSGTAKTITASINNQDLGVSLNLAGNASADLTIIIQNKNATNAQQVTNSSAPNAVAVQTTVDMTVAQNITIMGTLATAGDTLNVGRITAEVSNA